MHQWANNDVLNNAKISLFSLKNYSILKKLNHFFSVILSELNTQMQHTYLSMYSKYTRHLKSSSSGKRNNNNDNMISNTGALGGKIF